MIEAFIKSIRELIFQGNGLNSRVASPSEGYMSFFTFVRMEKENVVTRKSGKKKAMEL